MSFNTEPAILDVKIKSKNTIRFMTYNVHGFNSKNWKDTTEDIFLQIKKIDPDIFGIQEMHLGCPDRQTMYGYKEKFEKMGYIVKFSRCFVNIIGSKYDFDVEELDIGIGTGLLHRCALMGKNFKIDCVKNKLTVCTTHLEVSDKMGHLRTTQINSILTKIDNMVDNTVASDGSHIVIMGDFNSLRRADYNTEKWNLIVSVDKKRGIETVQDALPIIEAHRYIDSFIAHESEIPTVTVWTDRRVDYTYIKNVTVDDTFVVKTGLSDHYPVVTDLSFS